MGQYICVLCIFVCAFQLSCSKDKNTTSFRIQNITDDKYYFSFSIPEQWSYNFIENTDKTIRLVAADEPNEERFEIHVIKIMGKIDLEKLSKLGSTKVDDAEYQLKTSYDPDYFFVPWFMPPKRIIKTFNGKTQKLKIYAYEAQGGYGFILYLRGNEDSLPVFSEIIDSFTANVPLSERSRPTINYIGILVLALLLGVCGMSFRSYLVKKNILGIAITPIFAVVLYFVGFFSIEGSLGDVFIFVSPILPILGYFNIIRMIDLDEFLKQL